MKVAIIVRTDLKMGKGKIAGQVAHACIGLIRYKTGSQTDEKINDWIDGCNQTKIILKVKDEKELGDILERASKIDIPFWCVRDAGKTQIEEDTLTCAAIGPMSDNDAEKVTGDLKLL